MLIRFMGFGWYRAELILGQQETELCKVSKGHKLFVVSLACLLSPRHFIHLSSFTLFLSISVGPDIVRLSLSNDRYGTLPYLL